MVKGDLLEGGYADHPAALNLLAHGHGTITRKYPRQTHRRAASGYHSR
jgi:hypothetical protein